jgi:hypothetical protein
MFEAISSCKSRSAGLFATISPFYNAVITAIAFLKLGAISSYSLLSPTQASEDIRFYLG